MHILREIDALNPAHVALFEEIVRDLRLSSGIYRTTTRSRFAWLDAAVQPLVSDSLREVDVLRVEDWATSDGLAAMEWAQSLSAMNLRMEMTASDLFLSLVECARPDGRVWIAEPDGRLLQFVQPPFVVSLREREPAAYPVHRFIAARAMRAVGSLQPALRGIAWSSPLDETTHESGEWRFRQIPLVHPEARVFCRTHPWFRMALHNVFTARRPTVHVIRSMNILNRGYFDIETLRSGVRAAFESLVEGGLWIVGNTGNLANAQRNASIYVRQGTGLALKERIGKGSEIDELASEVSNRR